MSEFRKGSCLCGGVSYTVTGSMSNVTTCHPVEHSCTLGVHYADVVSGAEDGSRRCRTCDPVGGRGQG